MTTRTATRSFIQRWAKALTGGAVLALGFGALMAWRNPQDPMWVTLAVYAAGAWPWISALLQWTWFDKESIDAEIDRGRDSIEFSWHQEAAATSFYTLIGGLIALETLGDVARLDWLSPIGLIHVVALGGLTYLASLLYLRAKHS